MTDITVAYMTGYTGYLALLQMKYPMQGIAIKLPKNLNKPFLKDLTDDIKKHFPEAEITWYNRSLEIYERTSNFESSTFEHSNAVLVKLNGKRILDAFKFKDFTYGVIILFQGNLRKNEYDIISDIFKSKGLETPDRQKKKNIKSCLTAFFGSFIFSFMILVLLLYILNEVPNATEYVIVFLLMLIASLIIPTYPFIQFRYWKRMNYQN